MGFLVAHTVKHLPAILGTWVQFLGWEYPVENGMATHFSIPTRKIPWTEEPGGLQSDTTEQLTLSHSSFRIVMSSANIEFYFFPIFLPFISFNFKNFALFNWLRLPLQYWIEGMTVSNFAFSVWAKIFRLSLLNTKLASGF